MVEFVNLALRTDRLDLAEWSAFLGDPAKKRTLEQALAGMLTPNITRYLPPSLQFDPTKDQIGEWINGLAAEADVLCVHAREDNALVGLMILASEPIPNSTTHLGYFLAEKDWGKGYATEMVTALVAHFKSGPPTRIAAGVDSSNAASANVLKKAGFNWLAEESTVDRDFFELVV